MSVTVNIHEAKTQFSRLIARVGEGEDIIIARAGNPIARLIPIGKRPEQRIPGSAKDKVVIAEDFNEPLPDSVMEAFEK